MGGRIVIKININARKNTSPQDVINWFFWKSKCKLTVLQSTGYDFYIWNSYLERAECLKILFTK